MPASVTTLQADSGRFQGFDLILSDTAAGAGLQHTDATAAPATTYYYAALLYRQRANDPTIYLSAPLVSAKTVTGTPANALVSLDFTGLLTVSEDEAGKSEYTYSVSVQRYYPDNSVYGREIVLSSISHSSGISLDNRESFLFNTSMKEAKMASGDFVLAYEIPGAGDVLYLDTTGSSAGLDIASLGGYLPNVFPETYWGQGNDFRIPRIEGYYFAVKLRAWEYDGGATTVANDEVIFSYNAAQDAFTASPASLLSSKGAASNHINQSNATAEKDKNYILNPYVYSSLEGKMQFFFDLRWSVVK